MLFIIGFLFFQKSSISKTQGVIIALVVFAGLAMSSGLGINLGKYEASRISSYSSARTVYYDQALAQQSGGVAALRSMPAFVQFFANVPGQVVRPLGIEDFRKPLRASLARYDVINHISIGNAVTTLTIIFLAGLYMRGIAYCVVAKDKSAKWFLFVFVSCVTLSGFFAIVDRNRVFFIPFFITLMALSFKLDSHMFRNNFISLLVSRKIVSIFVAIAVVITTLII